MKIKDLKKEINSAISENDTRFLDFCKELGLLTEENEIAADGITVEGFIARRQDRLYLKEDASRHLEDILANSYVFESIKDLDSFLELLVERYTDSQDCNIPENVLWENVVIESFRGEFLSDDLVACKLLNEGKKELFSFEDNIFAALERNDIFFLRVDSETFFANRENLERISAVAAEEEYSVKAAEVEGLSECPLYALEATANEALRSVSLGTFTVDVVLQSNGTYDVYIAHEGSSGEHYEGITADKIGELVAGDIECLAEALM